MFTKRILIEKIGKTAIQPAKALNPINSISFQRPKIRLVMRPLRLFRERYIEIDSHNDIDSLDERYSVYQNKKQNIWTACWEYLMGLYGHLFKYRLARCSLIATFEAEENFSYEQVFLYFFTELLRQNTSNFYSLNNQNRENKNDNKAKNPCFYEIAGVFAALIHSGINQIRELGVSEQMFRTEQNNRPKRFG